MKKYLAIVVDSVTQNIYWANTTLLEDETEANELAKKMAHLIGTKPLLGIILELKCGAIEFTEDRGKWTDENGNTVSDYLSVAEEPVFRIDHEKD